MSPPPHNKILADVRSDQMSEWKTLSAAKAAQFMCVRQRRSQLQKIARHYRDDHTFNWRECIRLIINEPLFLAPGCYLVRGRREKWAAANVAAALCFGLHAPFSSLTEVPPEILAQCEEGASEALVDGKGRRIRYDGAYMGDALCMTSNVRDHLKCWQIWPAGWTRADLDARCRERAKERRQRNRATDRDRKAAERRAKGSVPRDEYLAPAALRRLACKIAGITERTFYRRSEVEKAELLEAARKHVSCQREDVRGGSARQNSIIVPTDEPLTQDLLSKEEPVFSDDGAGAPYKARIPDASAIIERPIIISIIMIVRDGRRFRIVAPDAPKKAVA